MSDPHRIFGRRREGGLADAVGRAREGNGKPEAGTAVTLRGRRLRPAVATTRGALYESDCLHLLSLLHGESVDCFFADPPFNLGKDYGSRRVRDDRDGGEYLSWCESWLMEACRVLRPGGSLFVYSLPRWAYRFATFLDDRLDFRHWIALTMKSTYPRGRRLYPAHYALLYFTKGEPKTFARLRTPIPACRHCGGDIRDYGGHRKALNPAGLSLTDFWDDTSPNRHRNTKARSGINELKPRIPERCIQISTEPGDVVMDPFGGGGSTFEAAQGLDRYWIGSEIGDCRPARERIRKGFPLTVRKEAPSRILEVFGGSIQPALW